MTQRLVVIGAGGFGREALDVVEAINRMAAESVFQVVGVADDAPTDAAREHLTARGVSLIGSIADWSGAHLGDQYLICIGDPIVRAEIDRRMLEAGHVAATAIHPNATVGSMGSIGAGTIICSGAEISTNVSLGRNVHINPNATIGHDVTLSECVSINPGAIISGDVMIGPQTLVGAGAVVLQGLTLGARCVVGASACVTRDVAAGATVKGVPAR